MKAFISISFLLFAGMSMAFPQRVTGIDDIYGFDPLLYNGKYYTFHTSAGTGGHQYFSQREFQSGSVRLRGIVYSGLNLNYDVYNQKLIFKYNIASGGVNEIIMSDAWLEAFTLQESNFEIITLRDSTKKIYQVIGDGPVRILYYWKKNLELNTFHGSKNFLFTSMREMNLLNGDMIMPYHNNRSFYSLFGPEKINLIRSYLRKNRINVKKSGDQEMARVIAYCSSL